MEHSFRRQDLIGGRLELVRATAEDDDLEAEIVVEVHVKRRPDLFPEIVLNLGQLLGELAHVVIVDERERRDAAGLRLRLRARDLAPNEIAQDLGA